MAFIYTVKNTLPCTTKIISLDKKAIEKEKGASSSVSTKAEIQKELLRKVLEKLRIFLSSMV